MDKVELGNAHRAEKLELITRQHRERDAMNERHGVERLTLRLEQSRQKALLKMGIVW